MRGHLRVFAHLFVFALAIAFPLLALTSTAAAEGPNAIVPVPSGTSADSCRDNTLAANDDGSTIVIGLPFTINFFGNNFASAYVNNNGNITFTGPLSTYTPFAISGARTPIIAPFFADVDTRGAGSGLVQYSGRSFGFGTFAGRTTFCANWVNVGYYGGHTDKLNSFQLLLVDRSDVGVGDFDIYFNYDKVRWETGDASGGSGGLGGFPARIGYSNGTTASFEMPGSGVTHAFLDDSGTGLIQSSRNSTQLGRYIFNVRNGAAPTGATLSGNVYANTPGNGIIGAFVQACGFQGGCNLATTGVGGAYSITGVAPDTYLLSATGPGVTNLSPTTLPPVTVTGTANVTGLNFVLTGPTPPPPGTTITQRGTNPAGLPIIYWQDNLTLTTTGCLGGTASYQMTIGAVTIRSGAMTEGPAGTYAATIPAPFPDHGYAHVVIQIVCGGVTNTTAFDIYIDPSGVVRTTTGAPIAGATVRLLRSDSSSGPFTAVPNGSGIMSVANRHNPDTTDAAGHFGWDVVAGFYQVEASAPDCVSPTDPSQASVRSAVLTIPPAVTNLDLRLQCVNRDTTPPVSTATPSPAANANGWNKTDVTVTIAATDETGGSGVRDITYSLAGAQTLADTSFPGASATTTVTAEGLTTATYHATDNAGNAEPPHGLLVKIDKTPPTVTATATPAANADGWNNTPVLVHVAATDTGSGIDGTAVYDTTLSTAGASQVVDRTFFDRAGNSRSVSVSVSIDLRAPTTATTATPGPNANGWNRGPVSVGLTATDDLSGVASTEFSLDGATFNTYAGAISVTGNGVHTLRYRSTDRAGNVEDTQTLSVRIDGIAPEGYFRFDDATRDLIFVGRDTGSGAGPTVLTIAPAQGKHESRTYHVADRAGNWIDVVVNVQRGLKEVHGWIESISYNGDVPLTQFQNQIHASWSINDSGGLKQLEQGIELDSGDGTNAHFSDKKNETRIEGPVPHLVPGLSYLRLVTDHGILRIETD